MQGVARKFFTMAVIYSLLGMTLGLSMAMSQDHSQVATHAHVMVLGWLMSAVFAFFYQLVPAAGASRLAGIHFWLAALSRPRHVHRALRALWRQPVDRAAARGPPPWPISQPRFCSPTSRSPRCGAARRQRRTAHGTELTTIFRPFRPGR
jgi:hypothetical protein